MARPRDPEPPSRLLLAAFGVEWLPRSLAGGGASVETHRGGGVMTPAPVADLVELAARVASCHGCSLAAGRSRTVFGDGPDNARLMFIGEGPGQEEDRQGIPFVGRAGQLLNRMLEKLGIPRRTVYIANVVKCRPPGNRDPQPEEAEACFGYLRAQIEAVNPEVIVTLGRVPTQRLLDSPRPIHAVRGKTFDVLGRKLVPTYHPSYLLRLPAARWETWEDMKVVLGLLGLPDPDSTRC